MLWQRLRTLGRHQAAVNLSESLQSLQAWFATDIGSSLLQAERPLIEAELSGLFGYHLLEMTVAGDVTFAVDSPIHHRLVITPRSPQTFADQKPILAEADALPLACDTVDVAVLHHILEYSANPHHVLREIARVMIPRGHIVLVGYNPWSLMGLWRYWAGIFSPAAQWQGHAFSQTRINDWLNLLDLTPVRVQRTYFRLPVGSRRVQELFSWLDRVGQWLGLPFGGCYIVTARKDINAVTPMKPVWAEAAVRKRQVALAIVPAAHRVRENTER